MKHMPLSQGDRQDMPADFLDSPKINTDVLKSDKEIPLDAQR